MKKEDKGSNIIHIDLDSRDEYINKFDDNKISDDLHDYIIEKAMEVDSKRKIIIKVKIKYLYELDEKRKIEHLIREDIRVELEEKKIKKKKYQARDIYFIFLGISCIMISIMFNYIEFQLLAEMFMIAGWVLVWEVVDSILFVETEERKKKRKYLQLAKADILFFD